MREIPVPASGARVGAGGWRADRAARAGRRDRARKRTVSVPHWYPANTLPTVSETLKDGWVKSLAMFVVVYYLLDRLLAFAYYHQLVETAMHVELPTSRWGAKTHYL